MSAGAGQQVPTLRWQHEDARAAFSGRAGGASAPPFEHLNLGLHVGDDPAIVDANRSTLARSLGLDPASVRTTLQVHGTGVWRDGVGVPAGVWGEGVPPADADALITTRDSGHAVAVLIADCAPVVIATPREVAVVHAGWRGLVAGVVEAAVDQLDLAAPGAARAVVGPCIGPCCFEVGEEVASRFPPSAHRPGRGDRLHVDQRAEVVRRLAARGIACDVLDACTSCDTAWFSHRRATGREGAPAAGRQAAIAWFAPPS